MMIFENICKHCHIKFTTDEYPETLCPECQLLRFEGTLRICDRCGATWEVEYGECGFCVTDDMGYPIELCPECEKAEIND